MASSSLPTEVRQKKWDKKSFEKIGEEIINFYTSPTGGNYSKKLTVEKFESVRPAEWIYGILRRYDKRKCIYTRKGERKRTASTPENMQRMAEILKRDPTISNIRLAREMNMNDRTTARMLIEYRNQTQGLNESGGGSGWGLEQEQSMSSIPDLDTVPGSSQVQATTPSQTLLSGTPVHCFLCDSLDANVLNFSLPAAATTPVPCEVERSISVIGLLKSVLGMKGEDLSDVMEGMEGKSPSDWGISVCPNSECWGAVEKAFHLWKEIKKLEVQLKKKRKNILERMRRCGNRKELRDDEVMLKERIHEVVQNVEGQMHKETSEALMMEPIKIEQDLDDYNDDFDGSWVHEDESDEDWDIKKVELSEGGDLRRKRRRTKRKVEKFTFDDDLSSPNPSDEGKRPRRKKLKRKLKKAELANEEQSDLIKMKAKRKRKSGSPKPEVVLYSCKNCPQLEKMDQDKFIAHICFHAGHPSKCTECNLYFPKGVTDQTLQKHFAERHPEAQSFVGKIVEVPVDTGGMWLCPITECQGKFGNAEERDGHLRADHEDLVSTEARQTSCSICPSEFFNVTELRLHKAIEHPADAFVSCPYCDLQFEISSAKGDAKLLDLDKLKDHLREQHPGRPEKPSRAAPVRFLQTCPLCGVVFCSTHYTKLDNHLAQEHNLKLYETYSCPVCPKKMRHADVWRHNKERHLPGPFRPYICHFCGKGFRKRENRRCHEQIHINKDTKPFQCELCGCSFAVKTYLYIHNKLKHQHRPSPSSATPRKRKSKAKSKSSDSAGTSAAPQSYQGGVYSNDGHDDVRPYF